jgi:hypothetical protein
MMDKYIETTERVPKDVGDDITSVSILYAWWCINYTTLWPIPTSLNRSLLAMVITWLPLPNLVWKEEIND